MPQAQTQSISREKFLTMAANLLHKVLLDVPRTEAKNAYKEIVKGQAIHLATVRMEDQSTVRFQVSLDHSEYKGKMNFGAFRNSLVLLISNLGQALNDKKEITMFSAENDQNSTIFGVTAITQDENIPNIMVLGSDSQEGQPAVMLRLMYIDNSQFTAQSSQQEQSA
ncbi:MAG: hypothetical protein IMF06_06580 [Proteobacteria bacterium]|nr:hypothetical protein [Pseudomonadota bacterium]